MLRKVILFRRESSGRGHQGAGGKSVRILGHARYACVEAYNMASAWDLGTVGAEVGKKQHPRDNPPKTVEIHAKIHMSALESRNRRTQLSGNR